MYNNYLFISQAIHHLVCFQRYVATKQVYSSAETASSLWSSGQTAIWLNEALKLNMKSMDLEASVSGKHLAKVIIERWLIVIIKEGMLSSKR